MKKALLAFAVIGAMASCKKSSEGQKNCVTNAASLTGVYKITAQKYKASASAAEIDLFSSMQACAKDDTYELSAGGGYNTADAGINCGIPPAPPALNGWEINAAGSILVMGDETFTVKSFDCKNLVLSQSNVTAAGDEIITTYSKQ
jgi:hypothetical protein